MRTGFAPAGFKSSEILILPVFREFKLDNDTKCIFSFEKWIYFATI